MSEEFLEPDATDDAGAHAMPGSLYVVATPLGHARDVTLRALDILRTSDVIAAEDTRRTVPLLRRYGIATKPISLHAHNEAQRAASIVAALSAGKSVAVVTDAGTPAISDPGARAVRSVRDAGYPIVPIPGPSAVAAAVSAAGLQSERFLFLGFLPSTGKARRELLQGVAALPFALVIYEAPHRVRTAVADLAALLGVRSLVIARELTKKFETIARMPLDDATAWFDGDANRARGEFVLIVDAPNPDVGEPALAADVDRWLVELVRELPPARAARVVANMTGVERDRLYARAMALKRNRER